MTAAVFIGWTGRRAQRGAARNDAAHAGLGNPIGRRVDYVDGVPE